MRIHVGNLSLETKMEDLKRAFEKYGTVTKVDVVKDKETGKPRGFAFVEMTSTEHATKAIRGLHEQPLNGKTISVKEAIEKSEIGAR